jgi:hypothetical protein
MRIATTVDPIKAHMGEVDELVARAAARGRRIDAYFGSSRYFGAATPVTVSKDGTTVHFEWVGPFESRGARDITVPRIG